MNDQNTRIPFVESKQLREVLAEGENVIVIDVRGPEEYVAGHIEGAINVPSDQLAKQISNFAEDTMIVTVCNFGGSRSCGAAEQLRKLGRRAAALRGGMRGGERAIHPDKAD